MWFWPACAIAQVKRSEKQLLKRQKQTFFAHFASRSSTFVQGAKSYLYKIFENFTLFTESNAILRMLGEGGGGASLTYKIFKVVFDPFWRYEKKNNRPLWNVCPLIFEENSFYLFSFVKYVVCDIKTYHCHLNKIFVPTFGQLLENTDSSHKRSDRKYFKNGKYLPHSKVSTHACYIYQTQNCQTKNVEWIELFWELWPRLRRACWKLFFGGKSNLNGLHRQGEEYRWRKKDTRKGEIMLRK